MDIEGRLKTIEISDPVADWLLIHRTHLSSQDLRGCYLIDLLQDISPLLPFFEDHQVENLLDIGCGMGGIDILLHELFDCSVHLLDETGDGQTRSMFHNEVQPYNDMQVATEFLRKNGVTDIHTYPADPSLTIPCELIISLLSWGHHFPVETYLDLATRSLGEGGLLVLDIRFETEGEDFIIDNAPFTLKGRIALHGMNQKKSSRCIFEKGT